MSSAQNNQKRGHVWLLMISSPIMAVTCFCPAYNYHLVTETHRQRVIEKHRKLLNQGLRNRPVQEQDVEDSLIIRLCNCVLLSVGL